MFVRLLGLAVDDWNANISRLLITMSAVQVRASEPEKTLNKREVSEGVEPRGSAPFCFGISSGISSRRDRVLGSGGIGWGLVSPTCD